MNEQKNMILVFRWSVAVSLIASFFAVMLAFSMYSRIQFNQMNAIFCEMLRQEPEAEDLLFSTLKEYKKNQENGNNDFTDNAAREDVLSAWGYRRSDFAALFYGKHLAVSAAGCLVGIFLFVLMVYRRNHREAIRIRALTEYLEQVNSGKSLILTAFGEDKFSKLEDEIYKTVTFLCQTKDEAMQAKNDFAQNLSNIAHQIKTPLTSISLIMQRMGQDLDKDDQKQMQRQMQKQVQRQVERLMGLEEALLVLAKIDAGTLVLQKEETDVFTLLVLAADNLQELSDQFGVPIDVPELGQMAITADLDWTMEAIMNLMKNGIEHGSGGRIHCSYAQNPFYMDILIWDEGEGFAAEDILHLFERFYCGKNAGEGSLGIGLALAKEIIESQNGTIQARNRPEGGALFEIHFYCH